MFRTMADYVGLGIDAVGIGIIVFGLAWSIFRFATSGGSFEGRYRQIRHDAGRAILLGLEFLVAADIIRTVAVEPTLDNVATLGVIVLIRTFLSFTLEVELEGRLPWKTQAGHRAHMPEQ